MPLQPCASCGKDIASDALRCPHCGAKGPAYKTRKAVWILIVAGLLVVAIALTAKFGDFRTQEEKERDAAIESLTELSKQQGTYRR